MSDRFQELLDVKPSDEAPMEWIALAVYLKLPIVVAVIVLLARGTI